MSQVGYAFINFVLRLLESVYVRFYAETKLAIISDYVHGKNISFGVTE